MRKQRWLSVLLALVLILGTFPTAAQSDPAPAETENIPQEAPPADVPSSDGTSINFDGEEESLASVPAMQAEDAVKIIVTSNIQIPFVSDDSGTEFGLLLFDAPEPPEEKNIDGKY